MNRLLLSSPARSHRYVMALLLAACATALSARPLHAQFQGSPPTELAPKNQPALIERGASGAAPLAMKLLPGDLFQVQLYNVPKFDYKGRLDERGSVTLPLIGDVHLAGLSLSEAEHLLERMLRDGEMVKDPHVILTAIESPGRFATVTGEVKTPGPVPIYGDKRLLDVIAATGGFTPLASPVISIYRRDRAEPIQIHLSADASALSPANVAIEPGDSVVVPRVGVVYVVGATHSQGAIPLKNFSPLTLIEALSLAGGVNFEASLNKAYILRVQGDGRTEMPFDVSRVMKHTQPDIPLQNDDIILIPTNQMKAALKGGAAGVAASLVAGVGYITIR
jgi:polysaccharide export outer membrane protein